MHGGAALPTRMGSQQWRGFVGVWLGYAMDAYDLNRCSQILTDIAKEFDPTVRNSAWDVSLPAYYPSTTTKSGRDEDHRRIAYIRALGKGVQQGAPFTFDAIPSSEGLRLSAAG
jgi:hypothetical protein